MTPKQYDRQHLRHLSAMDRCIDKLFDKALKRLASYGIFLDKPLGDQPFSFADYPEVQQIIDGIFDEFRQSVEVTITKGLAWEDNLSASKATDIASRYGVAVAQQRSQAVAGFAQRKVGGLDLSQRVWNITDTFHKEVETAMDIALRDGTPANRLATDLKQYLKHPDKLFRRVRDEHGQLQLSKRAKEFHPGAGVYRSSYKNARRLAVTETNMAYHKADNERWRKLDFVLGYEVQVSGTNPNVCPLCVELAGKYPKEFEFVGWHPHCRCHAVPIMEDIDSFQARQKALLRGERIPATGQETAPPKNFTDHLKDNSDRIARSSKAGTLPYFVRDNYKVGKDGTLTPTFASPKKPSKPALPSIQERSKSRHEARTPEEVRDIKRRLIQRNADIRHANRTDEEVARIKQAVIDRRVNRNYGKRILATMDGISDVDTTRLRDLLQRGDHEAILQEARRLRDIGKEITSLKHLDNPLQVARNFSMADAKLVDKAVADKLKTFSGLSNEQRLKKLKFEAEWVENHKKYSTWSVARDAYKKEYAKVEQTIYWDEKKSALSTLKGFKTSSKLYKDDLGKLTDAIAKGDKATAESAIARLEKRRSDLLLKSQEKVKVAVSASGKSSSSYETLPELTERLGKDLPPTLKNLEKLIEKGLSTGDYSRYWTEAEIEKAERIIKEVIDNGCYGMNVPRCDGCGNEDVIDKIFSSWFKNQIETDTGKGLKSIPKRKKASRALFGTPPRIKAEEYEKYGFLMDKDIITQAHSSIAGQYWDYGDGIQVRFKKDKVIATFTMQDSLGSGLHPSLCSDPKISSFNPYTSKSIVERVTDTTSAIKATKEFARGYIELQYHGVLTPECVESVFIPQNVLRKLNADTLQLIKKSGAIVYSEDAYGNLITL